MLVEKKYRWRFKTDMVTPLTFREICFFIYLFDLGFAIPLLYFITFI